MIKSILFASITLFTAVQMNAQVEIYNEDFQLGLPVNYSIVDNDGHTVNAAVSDFSDAWVLIADPTNTTDSIMASTSYFSTEQQADRWLITPSIVLGAYGNFLSWEAKSHDPSYLEDYWILASRTDTQLSSFQDTIGYVSSETSTWKVNEMDMSSKGLDNEIVHIAFVNRTVDGFKLYIDDVKVVKEDPIGLNELNISAISVFPNPSSGLVHTYGLEDINNLKVVSLSGKILLESKTSTIDISSLDAGSYILIASNGLSTGRTTIIKR